VGRRAGAPASSAAALSALVAGAALAQPQENGNYDIVPFRVTDTSAEFSVRYDLDDWRYYNPGPDTFVRTPMWQEELSLRARGYVYHPALLDWTVEGGPLLVQYAYDSDQGDSSGSEALFNFATELDFLQRRGAPFTLHYRRDHPEITTGLSGRFLATTDEYGIRGILRPPAFRLFSNWEVGHWDSQGSGFGTTVDENIDHASFRTTLPYRKRDNLQLSLDWNQRNSRSGAPGLPIQDSTITSSSANLDGYNEFGTTDQGSLRQNLLWLSQDTELATLTEVDTLNYSGSFNWKFSDATRSFSNLRYTDTDRTGSWSRGGDLRAGVVYDITDDLIVSAEGDYARDESPGFSQDVAGARGSASYSRPLSFGTFGASLNLGLDRTDQKSDTDQVTVFDESLVLAGTSPVRLARDFVVVETVVITNVPKTQVFVEGVDYRLVTIGSTTSVERLITGSIVDGQTVLVTYDFLTGGTVKYDTLNEGLSLNLTLFRYYNLFFQYFNTSNDIVSGVATTPLNDVRRIEVGGRADYPLSQRWTVGGEYRYRDQQEDISPYTGHRLDTYAQVELPLNTSLRVGYILEQADIENSLEDIDATRYTVGLNTRLWGGVVLGYNADYLEDDGGTVYREELRHALRIDWGYRLVRFTLRADTADITQGDVRRDYTRVMGQVTRVFN